MYPLIVGAVIFVGLSLYCWWIDDEFATLVQWEEESATAGHIRYGLRWNDEA
ncbi:MAG: hypothetical protein KDE53_19085 [Caldilineaceae bacterium]|nr:hypothetical protein [Caldilineaceae bacterium]